MFLLIMSEVVYLFPYQGTFAFLCLWTDSSWSFPIFLLCCLPLSLLSSFSSLYMKEINPLSGLWIANILPSLSFALWICLLYFLQHTSVFFCCCYNWIYHFLCYCFDILRECQTLTSRQSRRYFESYIERYSLLYDNKTFPHDFF